MEEVGLERFVAKSPLVHDRHILVDLEGRSADEQAGATAMDEQANVLDLRNLDNRRKIARPAGLDELHGQRPVDRRARDRDLDAEARVADDIRLRGLRVRGTDGKALAASVDDDERRPVGRALASHGRAILVDELIPPRIVVAHDRAVLEPLREHRVEVARAVGLGILPLGLGVEAEHARDLCLGFLVLALEVFTLLVRPVEDVHAAHVPCREQRVPGLGSLEALLGRYLELRQLGADALPGEAEVDAVARQYERTCAVVDQHDERRAVRPAVASGAERQEDDRRENLGGEEPLGEGRRYGERLRDRPSPALPLPHLLRRRLLGRSGSGFGNISRCIGTQ